MVLQIFLSPNPLPVVSPSLHKSPPTHQYVVDWFPDFPEAESFSVFKARKIPSLYQKVYCQLYIIFISLFQLNGPPSTPMSRKVNYRESHHTKFLNKYEYE